MARIERRDFAYRLPKQGGVIDLMDGIFQLIFRLDEWQTNQILDSLSEEEIRYLTGDFSSFAVKREFIYWLEIKILGNKPSGLELPS
jgi:predicted Zn-dependent protease with MMP-like domain